MPTLDEIKERRAKIDGAPWTYENTGQTVFGFSPGGCNKTPSDYMVANIRGWGHLQYMGVERGDGKAKAMQDANGEFIAHAPEDVDALLKALTDADADLKETLRAVLFHFGPEGANRVCTHALKAREIRYDNNLMDEIEAGLTSVNSL